MRILIVGATSAIAQAAARIWADRGEDLILVVRDAARGQQVADDLRVRGARSAEVHASVPEGRFDVALIAQGVLEGTTAEVLRVNLVEPAQIVEWLVARATRIAVLSSVAGDRGRGKNPAYGAAKAGIDAYLSGLRQRGVMAITLKPGFVDTRMTDGQPKNALFATPERIAPGIVRAIDRGAAVVYLPSWWRLVMLVVRAIPEPIFRRLSF